MNVDKLNRSVTDTKTILAPAKAHNKPLQQQGLKQSAQFTQQETSVTMTASQNRVSYKVISQSTSAHLVVDGQRPGKPDPLPEEISKFNFENWLVMFWSLWAGLLEAHLPAGRRRIPYRICLGRPVRV